MMNAVSAVADKLAATPPRPTGEDTVKRVDAPRPTASPAQLPAAETEESAVVEISSQGASLAAAAAAPPAAAPPAPKSAAASASAVSDASDASEFDEADANQDGTVNVLERRAYDFMHPTLARYPGSADEKASAQKTVAAELKAYEAVARSGRDG
jgi:hypothetical protein